MNKFDIYEIVTQKIIDLLDRNLALKVIVELNPNYQIAILKRLGYEKTQKILSLMDPDEAVDVLCQFSSKRRDLILKQLEKKKKDEIEKLLKFKGTSIGEYLSTEFITAKPESTVSEVEKKIKKAKQVAALDGDPATLHPRQ